MSLRFAALGLLCQRSGSGYDLMQRFETTLVNVWSASQGQLYVELNKLAVDGLVDVTAAGSRGRKEYAVTDSGRAALLEWLHSPGVESPRSATLLKVFLFSEIETELAQRFFAAHEEESGRELDRLLAAGDDDAAPRDAVDTYAAIALDFGRRYAELNRDWARAAQSTISEHPR